MVVVIAYDIGDGRRRQEVSAVLEACGARVQYSVFECVVASPDVLREVIARVEAIVDEHDDQVRFYVLGLMPNHVSSGTDVFRSANRSGFCDVIAAIGVEQKGVRGGLSGEIRAPASRLFRWGDGCFVCVCAHAFPSGGSVSAPIAASCLLRGHKNELGSQPFARSAGHRNVMRARWP